MAVDDVGGFLCGSDWSRPVDRLLLRTFLLLFSVDKPRRGTCCYPDPVSLTVGFADTLPRVPINIYSRCPESVAFMDHDAPWG